MRSKGIPNIVSHFDCCPIKSDQHTDRAAMRRTTCDRRNQCTALNAVTHCTTVRIRGEHLHIRAALIRADKKVSKVSGRQLVAMIHCELQLTRQIRREKFKISLFRDHFQRTFNQISLHRESF